MKTFVQWMETMDQPVSYKWVDGDYPAAQFAIGDETYEVGLYPFGIDQNTGREQEIDVSFCLMKPDGDCDTDVTGTGHQFQVFATVHKVVQDYLDRNPNIRKVTYTGEGKGRVRLYDRLTQRVSRQTGWKPTIQSMGDEDDPEVKRFYTLTKPQ
jgi:hypothetical protein